MVFFQALEGIFIIFFIVSIGYYLTKIGWIQNEVLAFIPRLVNYVSLPAFTFWNITYLIGADKLISIIYGISVPVIALLLNLIIAVLLSNVLDLPHGQRGVFRAVCLCSNTVFIGIPVTLALFGQEGVPYALLYFLVNAVFFWTAGNYFISKDGNSNVAHAKLFSISSMKNILSPPLLALLFGVATLLFKISFPDFLMNSLKYLGNMTIPLSLLFIGAVIFGANLKDIRFSKDIAAVIITRFVIAPSLVLLVAWFIPIPEIMKKVFVIQSAMPAMIQVTIIAKVHGADAEYSAVLAALTTLFAAIAIPFYMVII